MTKHSIGQVLLKNLALRAVSDPRFRASGSANLQLAKAKNGKHSSWTTLITLTSLQDPPRPPLELLFVLPKQLMNISGPTAAAAFDGFLSPIGRQSTPPPASVEPPAILDTTDEPPPPRRRKSKPPPPPQKPMYRLLTLCDDLDSTPSSLKYQRGGGPKGHNGIRSLSSALGGGPSSRDFHRLWIGIGRPEERSQVARWVLSPLGREEVRACEMGEEGRGGMALEKAWAEVLRVAYDED
ncbi:hypothetical protein JCM11641_003386 [Rhodosporidiobolus odoratus]